MDETQSEESVASKGDPNYEGKYENGLFEGHGVYKYPDGKGRYVGEFSRGQFHGEGSLILAGGKFSGRWERGKFVHGGFVFDDGLQHKKLGQKSWEYCSPADRRFYPEIKAGVPKSKLSLLAVNMDNFSKVPVGCYDTVDGYMHPKKSCIYDYHTGEEIRIIHSEEREWILKNCREATAETFKE